MMKLRVYDNDRLRQVVEIERLDGSPSSPSTYRIVWRTPSGREERVVHDYTWTSGMWWKLLEMAQGDG